MRLTSLAAVASRAFCALVSPRAAELVIVPTLVNLSIFVKVPTFVKVPIFVKVPTFVKVPSFVRGSTVLSRHLSSVSMALTVDEKTRSEWIVIGISGVTCGGKTTLASRLLETLSPVHVFHQDKYFYPDESPRHVRCEGLPHNNYDVLSALDMEAFHRDVVATMLGQDKAHASSAAAGREGLRGKKFLVLEGFTALNYKPINELCDLRYYFVLEYSECAARRVLRLYEPPDVAGYFELCVWPEHLHYRAEIEKDKRVRLLDGTAPGALETVLADILALDKPSGQP